MKRHVENMTNGERYSNRATRFETQPHAWNSLDTSDESTLSLHRQLADAEVDSETPAIGSLRARLRLAGFETGKNPRGAVRCRSTPPLARTPIAPLH